MMTTRPYHLAHAKAFASPQGRTFARPGWCLSTLLVAKSAKIEGIFVGRANRAASGGQDPRGALPT
jgi:hypothetical protein